MLSKSIANVAIATGTITKTREIKKSNKRASNQNTKSLSLQGRIQ